MPPPPPVHRCRMARRCRRLPTGSQGQGRGQDHGERGGAKGRMGGSSHARPDAGSGRMVPRMAAPGQRPHNVAVIRRVGRRLLLAAAPAAAAARCFRQRERRHTARRWLRRSCPACSSPGAWIRCRWSGVALAAAAYLWAERHVARRHPANPPRAWRRWAFLGGLAAIVLALSSPIETLRGPALQRAHGAAHAAGAGCRPAAAARCAGDAGAARRVAIGPSPAAGACCTAAPLAVLTFPLVTWLRLRRGQLGLALQHPVRPGPGESSAALPAARHLPGCGAPLLVAGGRRRSGPMAPAPPGAALLPVPGDAAELVPGRGADERASGPLPALPEQPAHLGADRPGRPEPGRHRDVGRSATWSS